MTRHIAVFGEMGQKYASIIEDKMAGMDGDWQIEVWPVSYTHLTLPTILRV